MKKLSILCGAALVSLAATACKKSEDKKPEEKPTEQAKADPKPADKAAPPAAAAKPKTCADYGGHEKGDFFDMCKVKGAAPFDVEFNGDYKEDFGELKPLIKVTNRTDHETDWGSVTLWYYDKDGKLIDLKGDDGNSIGKFYNMNGSGVLRAKPGETVEVITGMKKDKVPPETAKIEVEVTGWGWDGPDGKDDDGLFFDPHSDVQDIDYSTRPQGGWKPGAAAAGSGTASASGS